MQAWGWFLFDLVPNLRLLGHSQKLLIGIKWKMSRIQPFILIRDPTYVDKGVRK